MKKLHTNKGFTMAELLIVVAIIAVLVGIAIPVFVDQTEKARESTDAANIRAMYSEVVTYILQSNGTEEITGTTYQLTMKQLTADWQNADAFTSMKELIKTGDKGKGTMTVEFTDGEASDPKTGEDALKAMGKNSTATFTYAVATASTPAKLTIKVTAHSTT